MKLGVWMVRILFETCDNMVGDRVEWEEEEYRPFWVCVDKDRLLVLWVDCASFKGPLEREGIWEEELGIERGLGMEDLEEEEEEEERTAEWLTGLVVSGWEATFPALEEKAGILEAGIVGEVDLGSPPDLLALPLACKQRCQKTWIFIPKIYHDEDVKMFNTFKLL